MLKKNVNLVADGVWKVSHRLYLSKMIIPIHIGKSHSTISSRTSYKHFIWKHKGMFGKNFFKMIQQLKTAILTAWNEMLDKFLHCFIQKELEVWFSM